MKVIGLIPSRLASSRLPAKALLDLDGLPLIIHVLKRTMLSNKLDEVYVCTDSDEIAETVKKHGGKVIMTKESHVNGTERIAEAAEYLDASLYVDIQGDEPLLNPDHVDAIIQKHLDNSSWDIVVPYLKIQDPCSPHIVKLTHDVNDRVLLMSRSVIPNPFSSEPSHYCKHLSIISFKPEALETFAILPPSPIELCESIELMRAVENGMILGTMELEGSSFSVDVEEDYIEAKAKILNDPIRKKY